MEEIRNTVLKVLPVILQRYEYRNVNKIMHIRDLIFKLITSMCVY